MRFAACSAIVVLGLTLATASADSLNGRADSRLVTLDVRASDKAGNPITSLTRDNFQLLVGGKPQELIGFESVSRAGQERLPDFQPGKIVLFLFDVHTMDAAQITIAQRAATNFVERHMGPGDRLGVAVYGRSLEITQPFSGDRQKVLDAVARPLASFGSSSLEKGFTGAEGLQLARNVLRSLRALTTELDQLDARKSVVVFTQDFGAPTGDEFPNLVEAARSSRVSFYTLITTRATARNRGAQRGNRSDGSRLRLSSLSPGGMALAAFPQQRGGPPQTPTGPTGSGISDPSGRESVTGLDAITAHRDVLQNLAKETYGEVVREANDLNKALDDLNRQFSNYYLLSFLLDRGRCLDTQKIEVKVNAKDVRLSYAKQYLPGGPGDAAVAAKTPRSVTSVLEAPSLPTSVAPLRFRTVITYPAEQVARVVLFVDPAQFSEADTTLVAVAIDESSSVSARYEGTRSPESVSSQGIPPHASLLLRAGNYRLRVAVADQKGLRSVGEEKISVPALSADKLNAGSLVVAQGVAALPETLRSLPARLFVEAHPLAFRGYDLVPSLTNEVDRQKPLALFFALYNVADVATAPQLRSEARLVNESGETFLLAPVEHRQTAQPVTQDTVLLGFTLPVGHLKPGSYRLVLDTQDPADKEIASCETAVVLR